MNKHESKYFNTAFLFDEALLIILEKKDIEYITVREICKQAGVNRSTFYLHYESIDDLLEETLKSITNKLISHYDETPEEIIRKVNSNSKENLNFINENYLKPYLKFVKDNKKVFIAAFKRPITMRSNEAYQNLEKYIFNPILSKYNVDEEKKKYILKFYVNGITAIIKEWTINNCNDSIENIMNIIIECVIQNKTTNL